MLENDTIVYLFGSNVEDLSNKLQEAIDSLMARYTPNRQAVNQSNLPSLQQLSQSSQSNIWTDLSDFAKILRWAVF